jgi:hypothetical protein
MIRDIRTAGWAVCLALSLVLTACGGGGGGGGGSPPAPTGTPSTGGGTPPSGGQPSGGGTPSSGGGTPPAGGGGATGISQEAYIKASNTGRADRFGWAIALSSDGNTLAVSAVGESSGATGIDGDQADNSLMDAGAVYVFVRSGATWVQQAYIKASNPDANDQFGTSVALSADGNTLAVGAFGEASAASGIDGNQADNTAAPNAGAVYMFVRTGTTWTQQAYIKASNPRPGAGFGVSVALSADGNTLAVGADGESSAATGINGNQADFSARNAGAAYVFVRNGTTWTQQAYVKASNTGLNDLFGLALALSADGNTLAVGAAGEASVAFGINGPQADNSLPDAGAVYVFVRSGAIWSQQAYIKGSNTGAGDAFGVRVSLSGDGNTLAVGAQREDSPATGIDGNQFDDTATDAGAVYLFVRSGATWSQQAYVKASNTGATNSPAGEAFGSSVALSHDGNLLAVGAGFESGAATGIGGDQTGDSLFSGAVYLFARANTTWTQQAYVKASNTVPNAFFGGAVALYGAGSVLAVGALGEPGAATGINGDQSVDVNFGLAGAIYVFR